jgi:hypothetical protein
MSTITDRETVAAAVRIVRELTEDVGASTRKYARSRGHCPLREFPRRRLPRN